MLIFDFDGVMVDSLDEVIVNSYNCVADCLLQRLDQLPARYATLFRKYRYLVQPAGDLLILAQWCLENGCLENGCLENGCLDKSKSSEEAHLSEEQWEKLRIAELPTLGPRREKFFGNRKLLLAQGEENWFALNRPYLPLWETLKKMDLRRFPILTNKNRSAAIALCHRFGLKVLEENVFSGDHGKTKVQNYLELIKKFDDVDAWNFVDDSLPNLIELEDELPVAQRPKMLLAHWGYVGPNDAAKAKEKGYSVFTQSDAINFITSNKQ